MRLPMSLAGLASDISGAARRRAAHRIRFGGAFRFDDRRRRSDTLVLVLAGFKDYLWPYSLERVARFAPAGADVCVASAGVRSEALSAIAARHGWSYISTESRRVATAQNIAIREHPDAEWIYKVDEDVLATERCFEHLFEGYRRVLDDGEYEPGFVAPILNVNGYAYVPFLQALGLLDSFAREFGGARRAHTGVPIHDDGHAAAWVWRHSVPLDEVASVFSQRRFEYSTVPLRFNTGFILLRRSLWSDMGGFRAALNPPGMGLDEADLCRECVALSRVMVVAHNTCAGHYSFGRQEAVMRELLDELRPGLELR